MSSLIGVGALERQAAEVSADPVVVWFFGGGYIFGSKTLFGSPVGLFNASSFMVTDANDSYDDIIYVGDPATASPDDLADGS